ncbi:integrase catalytic domain-containing protein [Nephila pilipes]|uniref:Integrase catalytic domain-containing protein n=1 Tax=Nephila pilipes TaxID=299642 RepID=A0A8X6N5Z4_NEPPI|nr:integrase catalytic domain-containing protein [Nephila pilipes]
MQERNCISASFVKKYWTLGGRRAVRKIWNACVRCRRFKSKSPVTDPLPLLSDRVEDENVFEVGVLIGDDVKRCLLWPLAQVLELIPGKDGLMRIVKLKNQSNTLIRPIQRVFLPEVSENNWKCLQLQGVQPTDTAKSPKQDSSEVNQLLMTRYGRAIRKPTKLNMLIISDVFE